MDRDATDSLSAVLERESIFHEIWEGEALLFSTVAHRWDCLLYTSDAADE